MALIGPQTRRRSNATTAFDLLTDSIAYMLEEPRRVHMSDWLIRGSVKIRNFIRDLNTEARDHGGRGTVKETVPPCNTVGCIAGTSLVLTGRVGARDECTTAIRVLSGTPVRQAIDTYGYKENDYTDLQQGFYNLFTNTDVDATYGTKAYARKVADRIAQFQKDHKAELIAVRIKPAPKKKGTTRHAAARH
jgi:hypothetical protein